MKPFVITNAQVVNEGRIFSSDILVKNGRIEKIASSVSEPNAGIIDAKGNFLIPGMIDDQVHFREPGLTHKAEIYTEAKAAVAGGITTFMDMPNTIPNTLTKELLEDKYSLAASKSLANFSFFMGVSNGNYDEVMRTDRKNVCGIKIFMGSSTGSMLVDDSSVLNKIFSATPMLIATHCEDEHTIRLNMDEARRKFGEDVPVTEHPHIRSAEACYISSSLAVSLANKYGTRLHVLHISSAKEISLFDNKASLENKKITAEACVHHLFFSDNDYQKLGTKIKWNPAIKTKNDRDAVLQAVIDNSIDIIATDHAPHTIAEKEQTYFKAPSGGPLVQHALPALLELVHDKKISLEKVVQKTSHDVARCFRIGERGFIREGYFADLALINFNKPFKVDQQSILSKCGWSPFENFNFRSSVEKTFVNGNMVYDNGMFNENSKGERVYFSHS